MVTADADPDDPLQVKLRAQLRGTVLSPRSADFERHRHQWNAAIDQFPRAIAICSDAEDVAIAIRIAADAAGAVTVRGGGHNIAGRSIKSGALLVDLSRLRDVVVNPVTRVAIVQGGALWSDVDAATAKHGLATTGGMISTTGVGGLTLGGGVGWLMRRYGLASDNLLRAHLVLADGRSIWASPDEHPDIFWALRGGAGGLGVVTSFEFRLHRLSQVLAGLIVHPATAAREILPRFRDFAAAAPPEFCGLSVLATAPPLPFLGAEWHGKPILILAVCWCGEVDAGERALGSLRGAGTPLAEHLGTMPYAQWQTMMDPSAPAGRHHYWKTANFLKLDDATLRILADAALDLPSPESEIHLQHLGGAVADHAEDDSAFAHRRAQFFVNLIGTTSVREELGNVLERVRRLHERISVSALPGQQPNFSVPDQGDTERWFGSAHALRLEELRRRYDPTGRFV
jgi:hypothetical protein